jgi:hypothetical protein
MVGRPVSTCGHGRLDAPAERGGPPPSHSLQRTVVASRVPALSSDSFGDSAEERGPGGRFWRRGSHQHHATDPAWPATDEIPPQDAPGPSSSRVSTQGKLPPLGRHLGRGVSSSIVRLTNCASPNPRLQRTRLRAPLSRKTLDGQNLL